MNEFAKSVEYNRKYVYKKKFIIKDFQKIENMDVHEIINYIKKLHGLLEKREKKLKKYKERVKQLGKKLKKLKKCALQENTDSNTKNNCVETKQEEPKEKSKFLDEIREAAELVQVQQGFVYEPTSGLYYDKKTGYYYNAECGLYYDGNTGCYYKFHHDLNEFEFHSQVSATCSEAYQAQHNENNKKNCIFNGNIVNDLEQEYFLSKTQQRRRHMNLSKQKKINPIDYYPNVLKSSNREDGELSISNSDEEYQNNEVTHYQDIAKKYPPSLRIIVQETNLEKIKVGTLFIITFKGGTLGREGDHDIVIPDINISKFHLKFSYHEEKELYYCVDLGSRNGTLINGRRISPAKRESELTEIAHGSIIQISQTKLMCHIHSGNNTCELCEPGLLMETKETNRVELAILSHKEQLKQIQKRYGLENQQFFEPKLIKDEKYKDRAFDRRVKIGSTNHHEKTEVTSTEIQISTANKGYKMLSKLGWKEGDSLGQGHDGLLEPISLVSNEGTSGLGCKLYNSNKFETKKNKNWKKAQERYEKNFNNKMCDNIKD